LCPPDALDEFSGTFELATLSSRKLLLRRQGLPAERVRENRLGELVNICGSSSIARLQAFSESE
jgi:hypothetical protein